METTNIIIMVWMEYNEMNKYLCKSTTKFRKYNKMNTSGEMMMMVLMMMVMMPKTPRIFLAMRMMPGCEFPLQIHSGVEVFAFSGGCECRLPDSIARVATI